MWTLKTGTRRWKWTLVLWTKATSGSHDQSCKWKERKKKISQKGAMEVWMERNCILSSILSPGPATPTRHATPIAAAHKLSELPEWVQVREGIRKRPQHQCKVCSIRKTKVGQRSTTRFYCEACSNGNKRVYLCDRVRPGHYVNNNMTCHQIWHVKWMNGEERPRPRIGRDIQMRGLGKKRRRREDAETNEDSEPEEAPAEEETAPAVGETEPVVQEETVPAVDDSPVEVEAPATTALDGEGRVNSV
ncbi:hypothetical protein PF011_g17910 [Phytophthora fragariae]|uniref:PiggyBac transposable element-derived protein 4 C-terminal zinc-ribbon domain-containing protein n=1 Tax=Phytophthora fragariae TaxID=53985 RepID=A0A6A3JGB5_9STRA|nr:hypothetical protein PF011_g17910 [Phytophthora fragariae]